MKLTFVVILFIAYDLATAFGPVTSKSEKSTEIEAEYNYNGGDNNKIKRENNWRTEKVEEISQSEQNKNLKRSGPFDIWWNPPQTIPDQFHDYIEWSRSPLKEIEVEKIAKQNKKLENIVGDEDRIGINGRETRIRSQFLDDNSIKANTKHLHPHLKRYTEQENKFNEKEQESNLSYLPISASNEQTHISKIKDEVSKLQDLVQILRDQQNILRLLDEVDTTTNVEKMGDTTERRDLKENEMSELINTIFNGSDIGNEEIIKSKCCGKQEKDINGLKATLDRLNFFVRTTLLEKFDDEVTSRKRMENNFEKQLQRFNSDLLETKRVILSILKKLLGGNKSHTVMPEFHKKFDDNEFHNVLSQLKNLEKNISAIMETRSNQLQNNEIVGISIDDNLSNYETSVEDPPSLKSRITSARNTDDEDSIGGLNKLLKLIEKEEVSTESTMTKFKQLLKELDDPSNNNSIETVIDELDDDEANLPKSEDDITEAVLSLIKRLNKSTQPEKKRNRILGRLRKVLKTNSEKKQEKELVELLRKFVGDPEAKTLDNNVEDNELIANLKELSDEIKHLRQKNGALLDENQDEENANFQELLQKLIGPDKSTIKPNVLKTNSKLTKKQIAALIKKLSTPVNDDNAEIPKLEDGFMYHNIPLFGTYKCQKIPQYANQDNSFYNSYNPQFGQNPYDQDIQRYKPNIAQYPQNSYYPYHYPSNYNRNKLFHDYGNEVLPSPTQIQMLPNYQNELQNSYQTYAPQYPPSPAEDNPYYASQKVKDLTEQVENLKGIIMSLDRPEYTQKMEDKKTLDGLNMQIDDLRKVLYSMMNEPNYGGKTNYPIEANEASYNTHYTNTFPRNQYHTTTQNYLNPAVNFEPAPQIQLQSNADIQHYPLNNALAKALMKPSFASLNLNPTPKQIPQLQIPGLHQTGMYEKIKSESRETEKAEHKDRRKRGVDNIHVRTLSTALIRVLENELQDDVSEARIPESEDLDIEDASQEIPKEDFARTSAFDRYHNQNELTKKRTKKLGIFDKFLDKILDKIIDKLQIAIPQMIERLFGLNYFYINDIYSNDQYGSNVVQVFKNFGIGGYIPLIILKFAYSMSSLVYELQRYPFIRNFLIPGGIIGIVSALIVFLIYWLQPNYYGQGQYLTYQTESYNSYDQNKNQYGQNSYDEYKKPYYQNSNPYRNNHNYPTYSVDSKYKYNPFNPYKSNYNNLLTYRYPNNLYGNSYKTINDAYNAKYR